MNAYDTDLVKSIMKSSGCAVVQAPREADVIFVITCSVRDHAERRILGRVGELNRLKIEKPGMILGVLGCMAQRLGEEILEIAPHVDIVMGPDSYRKLPETVRLVRNSARQMAVLDRAENETYGDLEPREEGRVSVSVPVMRGCSEFCTYCIVPKVRGPERNRPPTEILGEVERAVESGALQVTLLGENITAYRHENMDLAGLLELVSGIPGLARLRFITSHPRHLSEAVGDVMARHTNICRHLHLPVQSGAKRILHVMGRRYTAEEYLAKVCSIRERIPGISITTDLIAGFPGESRAEFEETLSLMREIVFDEAFTYKYSPRPGTAAIRLGPEVEPDEAQRRLEELIALQRKHTAEKNHEFTGKSVEVFIEKQSRRGKGEFLGKTSCGRSVVCAGKGWKAGDLVHVRIHGTTGPTLLGCAA
jgi:tRNA-2-methylthio-N6-dimethylallyladenosine synthase